MSAAGSSSALAPTAEASAAAVEASPKPRGFWGGMGMSWTKKWGDPVTGIDCIWSTCLLVFPHV